MAVNIRIHGIGTGNMIVEPDVAAHAQRGGEVAIDIGPTESHLKSVRTFLRFSAIPITLFQSVTLIGQVGQPVQVRHYLGVEKDRCTYVLCFASAGESPSVRQLDSFDAIHALMYGVRH